MRGSLKPPCCCLEAQPVQSQLSPWLPPAPQIRRGLQELGAGPQLHTLHTRFLGGIFLLTHDLMSQKEPQKSTSGPPSSRDLEPLHGIPLSLSQTHLWWGAHTH